MTQNFQAAPEHSNRKPFVGAVAFFLILILIGVMFLIPKLRHRDTLEAEARVAAGPPTVLVTKLKDGQSGGHIELPATVQAFDQTPIYARTSGYVRSRYVDIGDRVRRGQL